MNPVFFIFQCVDNIHINNFLNQITHNAQRIANVFMLAF